MAGSTAIGCNGFVNWRVAAVADGGTTVIEMDVFGDV